MSEINEYISNIEELHDNLLDKINKAVKKNEGKILSMIKLRLFNYGLDGNNNEITPTYSSSTIEIKKSKKQRTSHVTLRDTGEFYRSMFVDMSGADIFIRSKDPKYSALASKYGKSILDLTEQEQNLIIDTIIEPIVVEELNKLNNQLDLF